MPSTYTTSLKIQEIASGEQSGYWGTTTNTNWTLIEQAVAGVQTITMANANYTLTNLNGVLDESRNAVLVVNGTNSGVFQIVTPLVEKTYTIRNATVGGYAITIGGATGSIVSIPNGTVAQVYCDGSNFFSAQTSSAGNFNVNGNLVVDGSITGTTASFSGNVTGTTATFSGAISSVSPSFTGTPTSPTAAAGTNTTQIATTAFVKTAVDAAFPSGTKLMFAQASAPTGWTQVTDDSANNRMLRVVTGSGAGTGGSASPILNDVVPYHTHGYSGNTGGQSADHAHYTSGSTGAMSANASHSHSVYDPGHAHSGVSGLANFSPTGDFSGNVYRLTYNGTGTATTGISLYATNTDHTHTWGNWSGGVNAGHTHAFSGTTDGGSSQTNWTPRYIDMILCSKN